MAALRHPEQSHLPRSLLLTLTASPFLCLAVGPQRNKHFAWEDTRSSLEPWQENYYTHCTFWTSHTCCCCSCPCQLQPFKALF